ncbi:porin [Burkholderia sp. Bp9017]|uniref:porin n=1 Tax=unclassified Burkholderia TaxID=2613784 RepID=UPI000F5F3DB1|nr:MULTISPECIES: porin [unclassified Burkholderia]RQZ15014.1 porin [Burkholderia sp. Bp9017]RQZ26606.1 porin [Burkholderia sp. Bp9016]
MKIRMKNIAFAIAALMASSLASAQSSVTLYGVVDASLVWRNHATPKGGDVVEMSNGAINHSRFGLLGNEDLGGGMSAIFRLESGFNPQDGSMASKNVIFDRYAYVGLKGHFGSLIAGNINTIFYNTMSNYDPLTVGNFYNTAWWFGTDSGKRPSAMYYEKELGPVRIGLSYGVGGVPGSVAQNSQFGGAIMYAGGSMTAGAVYQQTKAANYGGLQRIFGLGLTYAIGPATLYAGYQNNRDGTGIADTQLNIIGAPSGTADVKRRDQGFFAGVSYQLNPAVLLRQAYYYDNIHDAQKIAGNDGVRWALVSEAEYAFSKRTSVYGQVDYNHTSGAANVQLPGARNQTEVAIGLRHWF